MKTYLFILLLLVLNSLVEIGARRRRKNFTRMALLFSCLILWIFMAFRGQSVGADTKVYCRVFTSGAYATLEKGYVIFNKALRLVFSSPQTITIANSTVLLVLLYKTIRRMSPIPLLSIWLYVTLGIYQTEMNLMRNAMAIMLCYYATQYIPQRRAIKYILCVLLAMSFHLSSCLFLPVYWLSNKARITRRKLTVISVVVIVLPLIITRLTPYIYIYIYLFVTGVTPWRQEGNWSLNSCWWKRSSFSSLPLRCCA